MADAKPNIRPHKWLTEVGPEVGVDVAARVAVARRWETVTRYLRLAATSHEEDVEYVHQLRVATRRAEAALAQFAVALPKRSRKRALARLKRIRKSADAARNADVFLERLASADVEAAGIEQKDLERTVIARVARQRRRAQRPLVRVYATENARIAGRGHRLAAKIRWRGDGEVPRLDAFAVGQMGRAISAWESCGEALDDVASLHGFRIAGKRARYAMELFVAAFPASFRKELYPPFRELQDRLGVINDHATAIADCRRWRETSKKKAERRVLKQLIKFEQGELAAQRETFFGWWSAERASALRCRLDHLFDAGDVNAPEACEATDAESANGSGHTDRDGGGAEVKRGGFAAATGAAPEPFGGEWPAA